MIQKHERPSGDTYTINNNLDIWIVKNGEYWNAYRRCEKLIKGRRFWAHDNKALWKHGEIRNIRQAARRVQQEVK